MIVLTREPVDDCLDPRTSRRLSWPENQSTIVLTREPVDDYLDPRTSRRLSWPKNQSTIVLTREPVDDCLAEDFSASWLCFETRGAKPTSNWPTNKQKGSLVHSSCCSNPLWKKESHFQEISWFFVSPFKIQREPLIPLLQTGSDYLPFICRTSDTVWNKGPGGKSNARVGSSWLINIMWNGCLDSCLTDRWFISLHLKERVSEWAAQEGREGHNAGGWWAKTLNLKIPFFRFYLISDIHPRYSDSRLCLASSLFLPSLWNAHFFPSCLSK